MVCAGDLILKSIVRLHHEVFWLNPAKWIGTISGVAGAVLVALNIDISGYGFLLFLLSSLLWSMAGLIQRDSSLIVLQVTFVGINVVGIYRWLVI
jgi:drug/metabolite transporter (DMT)-like permease